MLHCTVEDGEITGEGVAESEGDATAVRFTPRGGVKHVRRSDGLCTARPGEPTDNGHVLGAGDVGVGVGDASTANSGKDGVEDASELGVTGAIGLASFVSDKAPHKFHSSVVVMSFTGSPIVALGVVGSGLSVADHDISTTGTAMLGELCGKSQSPDRKPESAWGDAEPDCI